MAIKYPDDDRNKQAASGLAALAQCVEQVPPELLAAYFELLESSTDSETEKEMLRSVGFSRSFASATEFVKALIAELTADAR